MNLILFFYLPAVINIHSVDSCKERYTDFILRKGFGEHSYYLNVCIRDNRRKKFNVVVTSNDLYLTLKEEQNITKEKYVEIVKRSILEDKPIDLLRSIDEYGQYIFDFCKKDKKINKVAKHGKDYFIKYFLGEGERDSNVPVIKEELNIAAIIKQLIIWEVPVKIGDNDGGFFADTVSFKCAQR